QRVTFGRPLADRQGIQWRLVDTYVALEAATLLVHRAATRADRGVDDRNEAYLVKLYCTEMAWQAADMCLQVHGGIGLTTDLPVERFWRDQRSHMITEGTPEIMRISRAQHVRLKATCRDRPSAFGPLARNAATGRCGFRYALTRTETLTLQLG